MSPYGRLARKCPPRLVFMDLIHVHAGHTCAVSNLVRKLQEKDNCWLLGRRVAASSYCPCYTISPLPRQFPAYKVLASTGNYLALRKRSTVEEGQLWVTTRPLCEPLFLLEKRLQARHLSWALGSDSWRGDACCRWPQAKRHSAQGILLARTRHARRMTSHVNSNPLHRDLRLWHTTAEADRTSSWSHHKARTAHCVRLEGRSQCDSSVSCSRRILLAWKGDQAIRVCWFLVRISAEQLLQDFLLRIRQGAGKLFGYQSFTPPLLLLRTRWCGSASVQIGSRGWNSQAEQDSRGIFSVGRGSEAADSRPRDTPRE